MPSSVSPASAGADRLRLDFDGSAVGSDSSGFANTGVVKAAHGGTVKLVAAGSGRAAKYPAPCAKEPCPNVMIQVADDSSLDPGTAAFQWGARILLKANQTADGENVLQKGTWGQPGGQWKLQVDKQAGKPSCVVSGTVPGTSTERRLVLQSSTTVADGSGTR
jgi:hypothetical protein